ncbi:MAG: aldolase/citrate lyase family protein [Leptospirales bacterium]
MTDSIDSKKYNTWRDKIEETNKKMNIVLPLKMLRQQTHFIAPASRYPLLEKAAFYGCQKTEELLQRTGLTLKEVLDTMQIDEKVGRDILENDPFAGLVLVDGEDGNSLDEKSIIEGRENAIQIFTSQGWGNSLRFYRPTGLLDIGDCFDDITTVLFGVATKCKNEFPVDGIILPKPNHPEELQWLCELLGDIEQKIGLAENSIQVEFLAESAWAMQNLSELAKQSRKRLAGIIFGKADYASELGIESLSDTHPMIQNARSNIINTAAAWGVVSIDSMTFSYPVADKNKSLEENGKIVLQKLMHVFNDTYEAAKLGMDGKWVGHPLQLFAAKLAYRKAQESVDTWVEQIKVYEQNSQGATMISGQMADRATDRQMRAMLRKAFVVGLISEQDALKYKIIEESELNELTNHR